MLVNGAIYADGKRMQSLDLDQLPRQFAEAEQFLWIALKDPSADELERLKFHFNLHPLAIEDAANGHQRP
ncbi:MAG: magnesium transporter, partial [Betaproteobacteria bacterium]|nr:magnesium transporter [Betaproteobacteria bacterium]